MQRSLAVADDLSEVLVSLLVLLAVLSVAALLLELRKRKERTRWIVLATGVAASVATLLALVRPTWVTSHRLAVAPKVLVLVDGSRRLLLKDGTATRWARALHVARDLERRFSDAKVELKAFGDDKTVTLSAVSASSNAESARPPFSRSDLKFTLRDWKTTEDAKAVVLVSDGRFEDMPDLEDWRHRGGPPIHTVAVTDRVPADASIRAVKTSGAAVAHQPFTLRVEVGCAGDLVCKTVSVEVRELLQGVAPVVLARGDARLSDDDRDGAGSHATLALPVTLNRAGNRIVEVRLLAPAGDTVPENDRRLLEISVTRDRIRLLHIAGTPTYDVRALRRWLKSDASIDLVAYFILRTALDDPNTIHDDELALIPFPVEQLFTSHLPSFDAVILQDIHAVEYGLDAYLEALENYVTDGGGLVLIGGPRAFAAGGYADGSLGRVLPVALHATEVPFQEKRLVPKYTAAGLETPILQRVLQMLGTELPEMAGSNTFGAVRTGAFVLWEHAERRVKGAPMAILALGEAGDGRVITLGVDESYKLGFGTLAASAAGRAYGALWDGLLGWLMRDPRYEASRLEPLTTCFAGEPFIARLTRVPGMDRTVKVTVDPLGVEQTAVAGSVPNATFEIPMGDALLREIQLGPLAEGGYSARVQAGSGPQSRHDFACEAGGEPFSDSRPDPTALGRIAAATGGTRVTGEHLDELVVPDPDQITQERYVDSLLPPWAWTALSATFLGIHWLVRRRAGLA